MVSDVAEGGAASSGVAADKVVAPTWRRLRFWFAFGAAVVVGAVLLALVTGDEGRPLDPGSSAKQGSQALARLLQQYGSPVERATSVDGAVAVADREATLLITAPDDYSARQLDRLRRSVRRVVLVEPGTRTLDRVAPDVQPDPKGDQSARADCPIRGAQAAGRVDWPGGALPYTAGPKGTTSCFGGLVVVADDVVVLGSGASLQNENLAREGVAALAVNVISVDRSASRVVWLLPGADAAGQGAASFWDLFPDGAYRVFWWLIALGFLVALWRARRLGGVLGEPLPVIVRSAELVEGHGRLYHRAGARDRAAHALRTASVRRLTVVLGLARGSRPSEVAAAAAPLAGRTPAEVTDLLDGPAPTDDAALVRLAVELDRIEAATGGALSEGN